MRAPVSLLSEGAIEDLLAAAEKCPPGCFVEVGVYMGGSGYHLAQLAKKQWRQCFLYDTFSGIPHKSSIDHHPLGDFGNADYETVKDSIPYAHVIKGVFPGSSVLMPPVAFAHLDCDQYQSIIESVNYLMHRMSMGGIMWFDDSPVLAGAKQAVYELFGDSPKLSRNGKHYVEMK